MARGKRYDRREFIKISSQGLAALAIGGSVGLPTIFSGGEAHAQPTLLDLDAPLAISMEEVMWEMVDGKQIYSWCFRDTVNGFIIPGSTLFSVEGDTIRLTVTNNLPGGTHGFSIPGVVESGPIAQGETVEVTFFAPIAGTYMYLDPENEPMNRCMGLHGMLVVLPRRGNSPYSNPTDSVQNVFNDLGTIDWVEGLGSDHYPGHPWDPARTWIWIFETIDSQKHAMVEANPGASAAMFANGYLPDYFLISGKGGYFLAHDKKIGPHGNIGQPALIRAMNAGLNNASPHIHGNHVYMLAQNNALSDVSALGLPPAMANGHIHDNVELIDTWIMRPGDRKDVLLPFMQPPDIPINARVNFNQGGLDPQGNAIQLAGLTENERAARLGPGVLTDPLRQFSPNPQRNCYPSVEEPFPYIFPMHDHDEIAQTMAHGNYPQGAVLHWSIDGPIDGRVEDVFGLDRSQILDVIPGADGVVQVTEATLLRKFNRLEVKGSYSGLNGTVIDIHGGPVATPESKIAEAIVDSNGRFAFRGRGMKAASGVITCVSQANGASAIALRLDVR